MLLRFYSDDTLKNNCHNALNSAGSGNNEVNIDEVNIVYFSDDDTFIIVLSVLGLVPVHVFSLSAKMILGKYFVNL